MTPLTSRIGVSVKQRLAVLLASLCVFLALEAPASAAPVDEATFGSQAFAALKGSLEPIPGRAFTVTSEGTAADTGVSLKTIVWTNPNGDVLAISQQGTMASQYFCQSGLRTCWVKYGNKAWSRTKPRAIPKIGYDRIFASTFTRNDGFSAGYDITDNVFTVQENGGGKRVFQFGEHTFTEITTLGDGRTVTLSYDMDVNPFRVKIPKKS